jgi:hypothetical protein
LRVGNAVAVAVCQHGVGCQRIKKAWVASRLGRVQAPWLIGAACD